MAMNMEDLKFPTKYIKWQIPKFVDLSMERSYILTSSAFSLYDTKDVWSLQILNDEVGYENKSLILRLIKESFSVERHVSFEMGIVYVDGKNVKSGKRNAKFKMGDYCGIYLIKLSALKNIIDAVAPDGILTVFCTATILDKPELFPSMDVATRITVTTQTPYSPTPSVTTLTPFSQTPSSVKTMETATWTTTAEDIPNLCKDLKDLYISKRFTDVAVQVKSKEFHAHRNILATRSAVFSSMFRHDTKESESGRVEIPDCDPDTFEDFLLFLYTGNLDAVTSSNAFSLYETSEKYDVQALKEKCVRCMINTLTVDSFCDVLQLATKYNEFELLKTATDFFINNTKDVLMTTKWHTFISENPLLGNELFLKIFTKP